MIKAIKYKNTIIVYLQFVTYNLNKAASESLEFRF